MTSFEQEELNSRERAYRSDRPVPDPRGRTVIIVDDGLATGATMRAAVAALRKPHPARIIVAVPMAAPETCDALRQEVDEVVCAETPEAFCAVGLLYDDFFETSDEEVRRAMARDNMISATHVAGDAIDTAARDVANRTRGLVARIRSRLTRDDVSDPILVERVRAKVGELAKHPRSIDVEAENGKITLRGPILAAEVDRLIKRVECVRGVRTVDSQLDVHEQPGDIPGLQGAPARPRSGRRPELMQTRWSPTARLLTGITGGALGLYGLRRAGMFGTAVGTAGLTLFMRALTNLELKRLVGVAAGRRAVTVQKTIDVAAAIEEVFDFWSRYENFPRFMSHVRDVGRISGERSRWTVAGPAGVPIEWETVVTEFVPSRVLAWKTVADSPVQHAGSVRFEANADGSTRLDIKMCYNPIAGAFGHLLATLLGDDPKQVMDEDLVRLKSLFEDGRTRAHGQSVTREELG